MRVGSVRAGREKRWIGLPAELGSNAAIEEAEDVTPLCPEGLADGEHPLDVARPLAIWAEEQSLLGR